MNNCKSGYYYCYTDKKCKPISKGMKVTAKYFGSGKDPEEVGIDKPLNGNGENGGGVSESKSGDSSLRDWFGKSRSSDGKPGWVQLGGKYAGKPCAKQPGQTTKPKCGSSKMKRNLDKDEEEAAFRRKQREDPNPDRKGKAINVKTEEKSCAHNGKGEKCEVHGMKCCPSVVSEEGKKDACYHKVKSRYSVWPSAYASGALVKCRKKGAANWGNKTKKEGFEYSNWRDDFRATEYEFIDLIKPEPIKGGQEQIDEMISTSGVRVPDQEQVKARKAKPEKKKLPKGYVKFFDKKGKGRIVDGKKVYEKFELEVPTGDIKNLTKKAVKRIDKDADGDVDSGDKGGGKYGEFVPSADGKKKVKTTVNNEGYSDWRSEINEGAAWTKKSGKDQEGGLNEKGRRSYEKENPGSDLKRPSKEVGNPRRKSFCARMKGMKKKLTSSKTANDPDSRINKSLRAWNC